MKPHLKQALCAKKLFQELGAEVFLSDSEIAHRVHSRQQNGAWKPIICKFVRCLAKASVMKHDKVPLKSTNQTSVCLLMVFLIESESSITSPPKNKTCCLKRRDVKKRTNTASFFFYGRMRVPDKITEIGSLRRFASET